MSIASAAAAAAHELPAAAKSAQKVITSGDTAHVLDDIGNDTLTLAKEASTVVANVEHTLAAPGLIARIFSKGKASTHLGTVSQLPKDALKVIRSEADELVLHGPQGAKFTFVRQDGTIKLSTQYDDAFKLPGREGMTVNQDQIPENIAHLMDETGFLAKATPVPVPEVAHAGSTVTVSPDSSSDVIAVTSSTAS